MVIKGGVINWSNMGDPNASLPTPQPCYYRPMYGAFGRTLQQTGISFVSTAAFESGIRERLGLERTVLPVRRTRQLTKSDMVRNAGMPRIDVDPETFEVTVDGVRAYVKPAERWGSSTGSVKRKPNKTHRNGNFYRNIEICTASRGKAVPRVPRRSTSTSDQWTAQKSRFTAAATAAATMPWRSRAARSCSTATW